MMIMIVMMMMMIIVIMLIIRYVFIHVLAQQHECHIQSQHMKISDKTIQIHKPLLILTLRLLMSYIYIYIYIWSS